MKQQFSIITTGMIAIIVGALSFYGGMVYQKSQNSPYQMGMGRQGGFAYQQNGNTGQATFRGTNGANMRNGFRPTAGEIISVDDKSMVVKAQDGSSKIVLFSESTNVNKAEKASISDLKVGEMVSVFGTQNTEGAVTAQNIQINPSQMGMQQKAPLSPAPSQ